MLSEKSIELIKEFKESKKDGWKFNEIIKFIFNCLESLVVVTKEFTDFTEEQRKIWICEELKEIYKEVKIKISKIPGFIQKMLEGIIFDYLLYPIVDWAYDYISDKIK